MKDEKTVDASKLDELLATDKKASELAKIILVKKATDDDYLSDLSDSEIAYMSILMAIQEKINSKFIGVLLKSFTDLRKSKGRKSRKELVDMFKSLREEQEGYRQQFRDLLGVG